MPIHGYGWKRTLNKIMLYVGLAILLGTVTMVVPLALLEPNAHIPDDNHNVTIPGEYVITVPETAEPNDQVRGNVSGGLLESGDFSAQVTTPGVAPEPAAAPDVSPQEPKLVVKTVENPSDLSPIGLMVIPSFLVALGVFVYLKKQMS